MKKLLFSVLFIASAGLALVGCSNGDYSSSPGSGGINPLNPTGGIDNTFGWMGNDPMTLEWNGNAWKADDIYLEEVVNNDKMWAVQGINYSGDTTACIVMFQKSVEAGKSYFLFYGNTDQTAYFTTKLSDYEHIYTSSLGSIGEVKILEHDESHIKGLFYFLAKSATNGQYLNVQKGYFNVHK